MSGRKLNPCPFCGAPMADYDYERDGNGEPPLPVAVVCMACSARGPFLMPGTDGQENRTEAQARVAWNCRSH